MLFGKKKRKAPVVRGAPPGMRGTPPRPGGTPPRPGQAPPPARPPVQDRYAQRVAKGPPKQKEKKTGNLIFRAIFFLGFIVTSVVLGPNYKLRGAAISFGLIGLMFICVILIDIVMWRCASCGKYMGFLPWPGQRCKRCRVKFF